MNETHEFPQPPENNNVLNPYLNELINKCLNTVIPKFVESNKKNKSSNLNDPKYNEYIKNLDFICESVANDSDLNYTIRGQNHDENKNIFYINISPKDQIDFNNTIKNGVFALKIEPDTIIKETQISIKPFCEYKGNKPDPAMLISQKGYLIDFCLRDVSSFIDQDGNQKINFSSKLAGLGIKLYYDDRCSTFLKTYIGDEDFKASKNEVTLNRTLSQKVYDFCSSKIPEPGKEF